jgi:hypothetical protein
MGIESSDQSKLKVISIRKVNQGHCLLSEDDQNIGRKISLFNNLFDRKSWHRLEEARVEIIFVKKTIQRLDKRLREKEKTQCVLDSEESNES